MQNIVVLSLPIPVLKYINAYVQDTPLSEQQLPLHEVFRLLVEAKNGTEVPLPDPASVFPYLGLYTIVTLRTNVVSETDITTRHFPSLSVLRDNTFIKAPARTLATAENAARIFYASAIDNATPKYGGVPISPQDPRFKEQRYWRIPVAAEAILSAFIERLNLDNSRCEAVILGRYIRSALERPRPGGDQPGGSKESDAGRGGRRGGRGRGGGGGRDGGDGGGDSTSRKRRDQGDNQGASKGKKPRKAAGLTLKHINSPVESQLSLRSHESKSMTCSHDSDTEKGLSVTAAHPHNKDDPRRWQFDPSFSTNKNVFVARAVSLVHP